MLHKGHLRRAVIAHLRDNHGAGYMMYLFSTMALLLFCGGIFALTEMRMNTRNIRQEIDTAANDVFTEIRRTSIDALALGTTTGSMSAYNNETVLSLLGQELQAGFTGYINPLDYPEDLKDFSADGWATVAYDGTQKLRFVINDVYFNYIDDVDSMATTADVNKDGSVDNTDSTLRTMITDYCATVQNSDADKGENSTAFLVLTMRVTIPLSYGSISAGYSSNYYSYFYPLNIKSA